MRRLTDLGRRRIMESLGSEFVVEFSDGFTSRGRFSAELDDDGRLGINVGNNMSGFTLTAARVWADGELVWDGWVTVPIVADDNLTITLTIID